MTVVRSDGGRSEHSADLRRRRFRRAAATPRQRRPPGGNPFRKNALLRPGRLRARRHRLPAASLIAKNSRMTSIYYTRSTALRSKSGMRPPARGMVPREFRKKLDIVESGLSGHQLWWPGDIGYRQRPPAVAHDTATPTTCASRQPQAPFSRARRGDPGAPRGTGPVSSTFRTATASDPAGRSVAKRARGGLCLEDGRIRAGGAACRAGGG